MLFRKAALITLFIIVLLVIAAGVWFWSSQTRLYSNPTALRTNDLDLRAHAPAEKLPSMPTNFFSSLVLEQKTNELQIWAPGGFQSNDPEYEPLQTHKANPSPSASPSHSVQIGSGSIRLAYIGIAHTVMRTNLDWSISLPANYYTPDLHPVSPEETTEVIQPYDRKIDFYGDFPTAKFYFVCSNVSAFKPFNFAAFDARTRHPLTQGYSSSYLSNVFYFGPTLRLWHQSPIELLVTVATGPAQSFTMPPSPGAELRYPGGAIRLLAVSDLDLGGMNTRFDGRTNHITFRAQTHPDWDDRPYCTFIFYSWPNTRLRGDFEYYDSAARKLPTSSSSSSGHVISARVNARLEEVKEIRFQYYPILHRISFTIPELPGLPEQNRNLENLFDIHIPAMQFRYEHDFQENIAQLIQMEQGSLPLTFSNAFFPTFRTNTTALALFNEMASMLSNKEHQLVADPVANKIESRPNPIIALIQKLKKKFGL